MITDTIILSTAWLHQSATGERPAHTLLVGAAALTVRHRFGAVSFDISADSTTVTDEPASTIIWLGEHLPSSSCRLLLWRAEDIMVPSLISAAGTAKDTMAAARMLRQLERLFTGEVIDVALAFGGAKATSFDAVAHEHGLPFVPMTRANLDHAYRSGCHGDIRDHVVARAKATWQLWLQRQTDADALNTASANWLATLDAHAKPG